MQTQQTQHDNTRSAIDTIMEENIVLRVVPNAYYYNGLDDLDNLTQGIGVWNVGDDTYTIYPTLY